MDIYGNRKKFENFRKLFRRKFLVNHFLSIFVYQIKNKR